MHQLDAVRYLPVSIFLTIIVTIRYLLQRYNYVKFYYCNIS